MSKNKGREYLPLWLLVLHRQGFQAYRAPGRTPGDQEEDRVTIYIVRALGPRVGYYQSCAFTKEDAANNMAAHMARQGWSVTRVTA